MLQEEYDTQPVEEPNCASLAADVVLAAAEHELPALHEAYCDGCGHPVWQWRDGEAHVETEAEARAIARARAAALLSAMPPLSEDAASADEPVAVAFRVGVKRLLTDFVLE